MKAYFIRKSHWKKMMIENSRLADIILSFRKKIMTDFLNRIYFPVQIY